MLLHVDKSPEESVLKKMRHIGKLQQQFKVAVDKVLSMVSHENMAQVTSPVTMVHSILVFCSCLMF